MNNWDGNDYDEGALAFNQADQKLWIWSFTVPPHTTRWLRARAPRRTRSLRIKSHDRAT